MHKKMLQGAAERKQHPKIICHFLGSRSDFPSCREICYKVQQKESNTPKKHLPFSRQPLRFPLMYRKMPQGAAIKQYSRMLFSRHPLIISFTCRKMLQGAAKKQLLAIFSATIQILLSALTLVVGQTNQRTNKQNADENTSE